MGISKHAPLLIKTNDILPESASEKSGHSALHVILFQKHLSDMRCRLLQVTRVMFLHNSENLVVPTRSRVVIKNELI